MTSYNRAQPMLPARSRHALATSMAAAIIAAVALFMQASASARPSVRAHGASSLSIGISDNSPTTFSDPRFRWLGMKSARLLVPWDIVKYPTELAWENAWLDAARAHHVTPLVAFNHDPHHPMLLPSLTAYGKAVKRFMTLYPWVHEYTPWNEENHYLQPTAKNPHRAAQYFDLLTLMCRTCTVTAADVLDIPNMAEWTEKFLRYARVRPRFWGLHNYVDLSAGEHTRTALFLSIVPGQVWFTETGGVVWRYEGSSHHYVVHDEAYAAKVAGNLLGLAAISSRVRRIYYYQWRVRYSLAWARRHGTITWDSGIIRPDCSLRPAFSVIARALGHNPAHAPHAKHNSAGACV
jgi:hypothetical protein